MSPRLFVVDVEATARSPHSGLMTEFGVVDFETSAWFHGVLYPSMPSPDNPAIPVLAMLPAHGHASWVSIGTPGLQVDAAPVTLCVTRRDVFAHLHDWVNEKAQGARPVLVSDNPGFDAAWMNYASDEAEIDNIFGHSSRRIGDFAAGLKNNWKDASSWKRYRRTRHDHHPVHDALGNAEALRVLFEKSRPVPGA
jgi:hypothetical protein